MTMGRETIHIPSIELQWGEWTAWDELRIDARQGEGVTVPNGRPGVYEVKYIDAEKRLTIGKASDLRMRVKQGLVKGKTSHSSGKRIRAKEDVSQIVVRWAVTDWPAAAEERLHKQHIERFGGLPLYTQHA
jgi:hypothetical protein